jgi:hypothetical protein
MTTLVAQQLLFFDPEQASSLEVIRMHLIFANLFAYDAERLICAESTKEKLDRPRLLLLRRKIMNARLAAKARTRARIS